jgi:Flp pilus assembly protein TadG
MKRASERNDCRGILSRILHDQKGNTIAIMAAAVIPTIGLVGGAVDIGRIYVAKVKLQAACDAGALMGRKVMANGVWDANSYAARTQAEKIFDHNFADGSYGSVGRTRVFSEDGSGNVSGVAGVSVPVTIFRPVLVPTTATSKFNELKAAFVAQHSRQPTPAEARALDEVAKNHAENKDYSVLIQTTCQSQMAIPNTDVMFVLDVTGSMAGSDGSGSTKINGLKVATKCFYETLQKEDIPSVTPTQCGTTANPTSGVSADIAVRFGFVPYDVNVNVGKLLPLNYIADNWTYQSREATWTTGTTYEAVYGTPTTPTETGTPLVDGATGWSGWDRHRSNVVDGGITYYSKFDADSASECSGTGVTPPNQSGSFTDPMQETSRTPTTPVHPTTTEIVVSSKQVSGTRDYEYRYTYSSRNDECRLERRDRYGTRTTRYFTHRIPVTWQLDRDFSHWTYKPTTFNISGLKNTSANAWNNSVSLPLGASGINEGRNWDGCIEERQTARVMDSDPSNDWGTIPAGAKDMNIDLAPVTTDPTTQWGPILDGVVYERYWNGTATTNTFTSLQESSSQGAKRQVNAYCPATAKLYEEWTPSNYEDYVDTLSPGGYTYHDIGLIWGARLMSPTGIFSGITNLADRDVQRHMIFMTDGDTNANPGSTSLSKSNGEDSAVYGAYGIDYWDRRQNDGTSNPTDAWLEANIDARTQAICTWVKSKNITLWTISFGSNVSDETKARLASCASPGKSYAATNSAALNTQFRAIAAEISLLRLTS